MHRQSFYNFQLGCCALAALFSGCAHVVPLSGGEPDRTPPKVLAVNPEQNKMVKESGKKVFYFKTDEYIQVKDASNEVSINPVCRQPVQVREKGKGFEIQIEDTLLSNCTYSIDFGKAIGDLRENNTLKDYNFVFSTGSNFDTASIKGIVKSSPNKEPLNGIRVNFYSDTSWNAPINSKPLYSFRTDENGSFNARWLKPGTYKVMAVRDNNKNLMYDQDESFAFLNQPISTDTINPIELQLSPPQSFKPYIKKVIFPFPGKAELVFNSSFNFFDCQMEVINYPENLYHSRWERDTLLIWYNFEALDNPIIKFKFNQVVCDSITLPAKANKNGKTLQSEKIPSISLGIYNGQSFVTNEVIYLRSNLSITKINADRIFILKNDSQLIQPKVNYPEPDLISRRYANEKDKSLLKISDKALFYGKSQILILPGALTCQTNETNTDTVKIPLSRPQESESGNISFELSNDRPHGLLFELRSDNKQLIRSIYMPANIKKQNIKVIGLQPGNYNLSVILDEDGNAGWSQANYFKKSQPEKILQYEQIIRVLPEWEIEVKWKP